MTNSSVQTSAIRLGVVMDPIEDIKYAKDSTLAMLLAAQARGFELVYMEQNDLSLRDGRAFARMRPLSVKADANDWFNLGEPKVAPLKGAVDVVLMRKDPPFDMEFIYTTYVLERAEEEGVLICNRPQGLRDMNEKVYTAWFPAGVRTHADHARHGRHGGLRARTRQGRVQAAGRHGRSLDLRGHRR